MNLWATGFPWDIINHCIDNTTLEYDPGDSARNAWQELTRFDWDNLHDSPNATVECPGCKGSVSVPWTIGDSLPSIDSTFSTFRGLADQNFATTCPKCSSTINHERLRLSKFRKDLTALLEHNLPMPGTFYGLTGVPETVRDYQVDQPTFPNRLLVVSQSNLLALSHCGLSPSSTLADIRRELEASLGDKRALTRASGGPGRVRISKEGRIAIRRMMYHYWENSSPFSLDLVGAVIRQGVFVQKMDSIDWLHSPTVKTTMTRLIEKYYVFLKIMINNPRHMAVPTLDVDLAWHTHQLSPSRYYRFCIYSTRQRSPFNTSYLIDHDDKVDEGQLSDAFEWTTKIYRKYTNGGLYSECRCWYCEATRELDLHSGTAVISGSGRRARDAADTLHDKVSSDPEKNPHISAHNAVRPEPELFGAFGVTPRTLRAKLLRSNYEKACRRAEKRDRDGRKSGDDKRTPPDAYAWPMAYGYPVYMPGYAPYMCDPSINCDAYASNPSCMNLAPGAVGNCVAGACGGGVAAGGCSGGCSGGGGAPCAGGCGGGGCGGGGGGGGGGCGGGGGGG